jgi:hypothetical protein
MEPPSTPVTNTPVSGKPVTSDDLGPAVPLGAVREETLTSAEAGAVPRTIKPLREMRARRDALQGEVLKLKHQIKSLRESLALSKRRERSEMMETIAHLRDTKHALEAEESRLSQTITAMTRES